MTWGRVDDSLHSHPAVDDVSLAAMGLWALALSYCCDHLTDGHVATSRVAKLARGRLAGPKYAAELVKAGLWHAANDPCPKGHEGCNSSRREAEGYRYHDWSEYQPTRQEVLSDRQRRAEQGRKGGQKSKKSRSVPNGSADMGQADAYTNDASLSQADTQASASTAPEPPTRPDPTHKEEERERTPVRTEADLGPEAAFALSELRYYPVLARIAHPGIALALVAPVLDHHDPKGILATALEELATKAMVDEEAGEPWSIQHLRSASVGFVRQARKKWQTERTSDPPALPKLKLKSSVS